MASVLSELAGEEWQGMSKSIKKRISKLENVLVRNNTIQRITFKEEINLLRHEFTNRTINTDNVLGHMSQTLTDIQRKMKEMNKVIQHLD